MKKICLFFIKYYLIFLLIFRLIFNITLIYFKIEGSIYDLLNVLIIIFNYKMLIKYNNQIHLKRISYIIILFTLLINQSIYLFILSITTLFIIFYLNYIDDFIKKISIITMFLSLYFFPGIILGIMISMQNPIYHDTHYYCENYEIYIYSAGAMDSFHYQINKRKLILDFQNRLKIVYNKKVSDTKYEYDEILKKYKCKLVGEV